jgi:hypothetical protein
MSEKFDIYSKIFYRDVEKFVRYLCVLVLRHQMWVSNYFVNSFYSVPSKFIRRFAIQIGMYINRRGGKKAVEKYWKSLKELYSHWKFQEIPYGLLANV